MQATKPKHNAKTQRAARLSGVLHIVAKGHFEPPAKCGRWSDGSRPAPLPARPKHGRAVPKVSLRKRAAAKKHKSRRCDRI